MPIYRNLNTAFVHIPKTAGSSIANALYNENKQLGGLSYESDKHETILDIQKYLGGNRVFMPYYKFSVVRNPWDRLVSWYVYYKEVLLKDSSFAKSVPRKCTDSFISKEFNEWVASLNNSCSYCSNATVDCPMLPLIGQSRYITDYGGFVLVDDIIRFENLQEGWERVCKKIGLEDVKLQFLNKLNKKNYKSYYNQESIDIVSLLYKNDIEYFSYDY